MFGASGVDEEGVVTLLKRASRENMVVEIV